MNKRIGFALCILCLVLCVMMTLVADDAGAQIIREEKEEKKQADGPTKAQMIIGIGSIFVMIIVVKYL